VKISGQMCLIINGYAFKEKNMASMAFDEFHNSERIRERLDSLMSKGGLGDNPIMGGESLYNFEYEKPEYIKFTELRRLLHGNRHCHPKDFTCWPKEADGLLYFFMDFGRKQWGPDINGIRFVIQKMKELPKFREQEKIIMLLHELLSFVQVPGKAKTVT